MHVIKGGGCGHRRGSRQEGLARGERLVSETGTGMQSVPNLGI